MGRDLSESARSRPSTASTQRFFKVSTHSEPRFTNVGLKFRSGALDMEVGLTEKLRRFSDDEKDPSLIAMRRKIFADLFEEVIEKDDTYGSLLARIKEEYDRDSESGGSGGGGGDSSAYVEMNIELQQLKRAQTKATNENVQLRQDMEMLRKECDEYKYLLNQKSEDRGGEKKTADASTVAMKQQALANHISSLETNLHGSATSKAHGGSWGEIDRLLSQKDELEEKVITLTAELQLSRRREGDALAQLHDLRTQLQNTARSFTALTDYQSDHGDEYSDEDDDGEYYEAPTSTDEPSHVSTSADSFASLQRPAPVPKLPL